MVQTTTNSAKNAMAHHHGLRQIGRLFFLLMLLLVVPGCNYFILLGYLIDR